MIVWRACLHHTCNRPFAAMPEFDHIAEGFLFNSIKYRQRLRKED